MDTFTMPPTVDTPESEEERKRRAASVLTMPPAVSPATAPRPRVDSSSSMSMPPAGGGEFVGRVMDAVRDSSSVRPRLPAPAGARDVSAPDLGSAPAQPSAMPPVFSGGPSSQPNRPADPTSMPPYQPGPQEKMYEDAAQQERPQLHGIKKILDVLSQIHPLGRIVESNIPGSPGNYDAKLASLAQRAMQEQKIQVGERSGETAAAQAQFNTPDKRRSYMQQNPDLFEDVSDFQKNDWVLAGKFPQKEPAPEKATDKKIDEGYNAKGQRVHVYQRQDGSQYTKAFPDIVRQEQTTGHTSPFEAFAYGSPEEKRSAQDFLDLEHRLGSRYRSPSEFEEKYRLFKQDPETYRAMFGDKNAGGPDRATATKMLAYFDRRRREVNQDFTLEDSQKQEQLKDIENLEQPFLDAVQPGAGRGGAGAVGADDRVEVIHPNGQRGTIPRSQLGTAKKKGYRVVE
ncbi:MAG TPA: hypothetical protein VIW23_13880 [Candidatus Acidoferrum sp.]